MPHGSMHPKSKARRFKKISILCMSVIWTCPSDCEPLPGVVFIDRPIQDDGTCGERSFLRLSE